MMASSCSTAVSMSWARYSFALSTMSAGISSILKFSGWPDSSQMWAFIVSRSTTPTKSDSVPIGRTMTSGCAPRIFFTWATTR